MKNITDRNPNRAAVCSVLAGSCCLLPASPGLSGMVVTRWLHQVGAEASVGSRQPLQHLGDRSRTLPHPMAVSAEGPSHKLPPSLSPPASPVPLWVGAVPSAPLSTCSRSALLCLCHHCHDGHHPQQGLLGAARPPTTPCHANPLQRPLLHEANGRRVPMGGGSNGPSCPPHRHRAAPHTAPVEGIPTPHRAPLGGGIPAPPLAAFPPTDCALVICFVFQQQRYFTKKNRQQRAWFSVLSPLISGAPKSGVRSTWPRVQGALRLGVSRCEEIGGG